MKPKSISEKIESSSEAIIKFSLYIGTVLVITLMMTALLYPFLVPEEYELGEMAHTSVRAPKDFLLEDTIASERKRIDAGKSVPAVFSIVETELDLMLLQLNAFFEAISERYDEKLESNDKLLLSQSERKDFERQFGISLTEREWRFLENSNIWADIKNAVTTLVRPIYERGIIANKRVLREELDTRGAVLYRKLAGIEEPLSHINEPYDLVEVEEIFSSKFPRGGFGKGAEFDSLVKKLSLGYLQLKPNVFFDPTETERRIEFARASVDPIYNKINQGELIVRVNDRISQSQLSKLHRLREVYTSHNLLQTFFGYLLITSFVLLITYLFIVNAWNSFRPSNRDLALISITLVGSFALVHLYSILSMSLSLYFPNLGTNIFIYATPFAAGGILLQVTLGIPGVLLFLIPFAVFSTMFFDSTFVLLLLILLGNAVGVICVQQCVSRATFINAGFRVALINAVVIIGCLLLDGKGSHAQNLAAVAFAIIGGLTSGVLGAGLAPIAEFLGRYVTNIKLLELSSIDHPLLRELSLQAPGTWNHSMVIGQMGEAAAKAIGANSLLTRVGAYFHDIGKAKKPAYFVENQAGEENRHDKLIPSMSALIVRTHVKDGVEMAMEHRLPQAIIDFIPQHHGTALMEFFYEKALREAKEEESVSENNFRYPGPKPQTKEAGILMLADAVEASSRTLTDPTPAKIKGLVQKQINRVFASGELNECELTLKDLHAIAKSFTKVLSGIYHRRVEYSEPAEKVREIRSAEEASVGTKSVLGLEKKKKEEKRNGSRDSSKAKGEEQAGEAPSEKGANGGSKDTLKRLGG
jgi:cyclic-di-AMP phosphodiesterase PgpH